MNLSFPYPPQLLSQRIRRDLRAARERGVAAGTTLSGGLSQQQLVSVQRVWSDAIADVPYYTNLVSQRLAPAAIRSWDERRFQSPRQVLQDCVHEEAEVYNVQMRLDDSGIDVRLVVAPDADRPALETRVRARLTQVHPSLANVRIIYLEDIETNRAGKRRWLVDDRTGSCAESQAS